MHKFFVGKRGDSQISTDLLTAMFRQRHEVFYERLGWEVPSKNGLERDEFDDDHTVYIIARNLETRNVDASWRIRPTTVPYMLQKTFPQLLGAAPAPVSPKIWEVSRFAVCNTPYASGITQMGELSQDLLALTVRYGSDHGIDSYIWVTSVSVERLGTKLGYRPRRFAPPLRIGKVLSVAGEMHVDATARRIASERLQQHIAREAA